MKMNKLLPDLLLIAIFFILIIIQCSSITNAQGGPSLVHNIEPGMILNGPSQLQHLDIYCYEGQKKHIIHLWQTVQLNLNLTNNQFQQFEGATPEEVSKKLEDHQSSWNFNVFSWKKKNIRLNPFNHTCIGILSEKYYSIKLQLIRVDYWKILSMVCGLFVFVTAPKLSKNSLFYYLTGISIGMCASLLILIYIVSRLFPRKPIMYGFLLGGWSVGIYLFQFLWENIRTVAIEYRSHVLAYCAVTGILSFVICYRFGPVSDPRSINLIQWALQCISLLVIFTSSEFQEASLALVILILIFYNLPIKFYLKTALKVKYLWHKPKPRLLTEDEYHYQGVVETRKALDELRGYCSSPECNQWKTVLKLKHPLRFAEFMEGRSHLEDEEVLAFETVLKNSCSEELLTDDSSE